MDFALADLVLHLNDGKRGHVVIFSLIRLDVGIPSHIYYWANDTHRICVSAKKKHGKAKKKIDNLKGYKERIRRTITNWGGVCL